MNRRIFKQRARVSLKKNYAIFVFACLMAAVIGTQFSDSLQITKIKTVITDSDNSFTPLYVPTAQTMVSNLYNSGVNSDYYLMFKALFGNKASVDKEIENKIEQSKNDSSGISSKTKGAFAAMINSISSGAILVKVSRTLRNFVGNPNIALGIMISLSLMLQMALWFFIKNTYHVVFRRVMLEGSTYDEIPFNRFTFLLRLKKYTHVSWVMFVKSLYQFLWNLTIVGGIIKHYSYKMVPYILAENPTISAKDAINLSRRIMKEQKFECFKLDLSFLGWDLLDIISFGLTGVFYSNPYQIATYCQFYKAVRILAKNEPIDGAEMLFDTYLFEQADTSLLIEPYGDIISYIRIREVDYSFKGIYKILTDWFGVVLFYSKRVKKIEEQQMRHVRIDQYRSMLDGRAYPTRLYPIPVEEKNPRYIKINYMRQYSLSSLTIMFFLFSFAGWLWEVSLHLIEDGKFINRGISHGPWLPIYGTGCILILVVLYKLRKTPILEMISIIILCGSVEYMTSYILEIAHNGTKWWDYSGYFLNINGRVCAEGLIVFAIGGMAVVYVIAPLIDNILRKIKLKILISICIVLLSIFIADQIYSAKYPNKGEGITDYTSSNHILTDFYCAKEAPTFYN